MLKKLINSSSAGLSILISVILISLIVVFSIGVTTLVTDSARQAGNVKQGTTAYYAAEAGLEQALWVNRALTNQAEGAIGANEKGEIKTIGGANAASKFKIQGTTQNLLEKTVNGKYIIPFPWTGNVPWHGEGANAGSGGCNPEKPPGRGGSANGKSFEYEKVPVAYSGEIEHPCNWGKLGVGEKVSIPLYGVEAGGGMKKYDDIKVRVRMPCKDGKEFCAPGERLLLNCWDKGGGEKKCGVGQLSNFNHLKGEVILLWQINGIPLGGTELHTLNPFAGIQSGKYLPEDSQLYEGKLNNQQSTVKTFEVLNTNIAAFPIGGIYNYPVGVNLNTGVIAAVKDFIASISKPTLTLSIVSSLVGCSAGNSCTQDKDDPTKSNFDGPKMIPYVEYQIVLENGSAASSPVSKDNIISAEGQSGAFNQTIQVKIPTGSSALEYVIQQ